ncbi:60S ribosomal protein L21, partial [Galemys pyrenaicus]
MIKIGPYNTLTGTIISREMTKMTNINGKRRGAPPFRKHGVVLLVTCMQIYKKDDSLDSKGVGLFKMECPTCYHGNTRRVSNDTQHALTIVVNKQGQDSCQEIHTGIEHPRHSKSPESFLKPREVHYMRTKERGLNHWNPFPMKSWHD